MNFGLIDKPDKRKQHQKAVVRIGGISLIIGLYKGKHYFLAKYKMIY